MMVFLLAAVVGVGACLPSPGKACGDGWYAEGYRCASVDLAPTCIRSTCGDGIAGAEHGLAIGAFAVGGTAVGVGLALAWLNQPRAHRTEARPPSRIELTPILSSHLAELSALVRF